MKVMYIYNREYLRRVRRDIINYTAYGCGTKEYFKIVKQVEELFEKNKFVDTKSNDRYKVLEIVNELLIKLESIYGTDCLENSALDRLKYCLKDTQERLNLYCEYLDKIDEVNTRRLPYFYTEEEERIIRMLEHLKFLVDKTILNSKIKDYPPIRLSFRLDDLLNWFKDKSLTKASLVNKTFTKQMNKEKYIYDCFIDEIDVDEAIRDMESEFSKDCDTFLEKYKYSCIESNEYLGIMSVFGDLKYYLNIVVKPDLKYIRKLEHHEYFISNY